MRWRGKMTPYNSGKKRMSLWPTSREGKVLKERHAWGNMHSRCGNYGETVNPKNKSYVSDGSSVCEEWFDYQNFAAWWNNQEYKESDWCLDKDILVRGNKLYSPETCCFVPAEINILFINNRVSRGELPLGVHLHSYNKNYIASIKQESTDEYPSRTKHIGSFKTVEDAFSAYKVVKEDYIKQKAEKWKDKLDPRVYEAMMSWEVRITD